MAIPIAQLVVIAATLPKLLKEINESMEVVKNIIYKKDIKDLHQRVANIENVQINLLELTNKQQQVFENISFQMGHMFRQIKLLWVIIISIVIVNVLAILLGVLIN